ncbi:MAG: transcriptional regulator, Rrf2 family [Clostridia bacterium]|jgi:Rrf2 family protein|nr:transcriptional regulator, Rrf2 family [Clostridia bacterium]
MRISTKGRYGLRAMVDLAVFSLGEPLNLKSIAERQNVSDKYLEHIFSALKKAGLIKSIKGTQGGYILSDNPEQITVRSVVEALEGSLSTVESFSLEEGETDSLEQCINKEVWQKVDESVINVLNSITLEDLAQQYKKLKENEAYMYYI